MELMRRNGDAVPTEQEVVDRFGGKMRHWDTMPGVTNGPEMKILVDGLGFAARSDSTTKPDVLVAALKDPQLYGVLGFSEKFPNGSGGFTGHCVIVMPYVDGFEIWSPLQNGGSQLSPKLPWVEFSVFNITAAIFFRQ
jgi:hypothetical protein